MSSGNGSGGRKGVPGSRNANYKGLAVKCKDPVVAECPAAVSRKQVPPSGARGVGNEDVTGQGFPLILFFLL